MSEQKEIDYKEIEHRETEYARKHLVAGRFLTCVTCKPRKRRTWIGLHGLSSSFSTTEP